MFNRTKLDVFAIVEKEVEKFVLSQVPKVEKCIVREDKRNGRQVQILQTQGINLDVSVNICAFIFTILNFIHSILAL